MMISEGSKGYKIPTKGLTTFQKADGTKIVAKEKNTNTLM